MNASFLQCRFVCGLQISLLSLLLGACGTQRPQTSTKEGTHAEAAAAGTAANAKSTDLPPKFLDNGQPPEGAGWRALMDGRSLAGWKVADFGGHGEVSANHGRILMETGAALSGVAWTNSVLRQNYELVWDAMKIDGSDFFAALTAPYGTTYFTLVTGGWGGGVVGVSSIDSLDASENETMKFVGFEKGRWYRFRVRVIPNRIQAWIDDEQLVNVDLTERSVNLRPGDIDLCAPLGFATWQTTGALRGVWTRPVTASSKSEAASPP